MAETTLQTFNKTPYWRVFIAIKTRVRGEIPKQGRARLSLHKTRQPISPNPVHKHYTSGGEKGKKERQEESSRELLETFTSCSTAYLCLREIHGLSPAELLYSKAVSQPKHQLDKPFHPASPQPASDNIKIHEKKTLKSLPHRRDFRGHREHSTLVFTERKSPTPSLGLDTHPRTAEWIYAFLSGESHRTGVPSG